MNLSRFLSSLYFGDRYCVGESFDAANKIFTLKMNSISQITDSEDISWESIRRNSIDNASLRFNNVEKLVTTPEDFIINDEVYEITITTQIKDDLFEFTIFGSNVSEQGVTVEGYYTIWASTVCIVNPNDTV